MHLHFTHRAALKGLTLRVGATLLHAVNKPREKFGLPCIDQT